LNVPTSRRVLYGLVATPTEGNVFLAALTRHLPLPLLSWHLANCEQVRTLTGTTPSHPQVRRDSSQSHSPIPRRKDIDEAAMREVKDGARKGRIEADKGPRKATVPRRQDDLQLIQELMAKGRTRMTGIASDKGPRVDGMATAQQQSARDPFQDYPQDIFVLRAPEWPLQVHRQGQRPGTHRVASSPGDATSQPTYQPPRRS
jgi:hypothetical protein